MQLDQKALIEEAVQASIDAGLAVNGEHGVAAARHAARFMFNALQAVQPVPVAWQPIETAPKEGAYFIYQPAEKSGRYVLPARILLNGDGGRRTSSHWMPLPAAPVSGGHNAK